MRVMFAVWPAASHLYPAIPLAWALQGAGHEVCFASSHDLADTITAAGLNAVGLGDPDTMPSLDYETVQRFTLDDEDRDRVIDAFADDPAEREAATMFATFLMTSMRMFHHGPGRLPGVDDLVDFAVAWKPDLVLWDMLWPAAAIAARVSGAAHARQLWGPDYCGWAVENLPRDANPLVEMMRPLAQRHGVELDDDLLLGQWTIDPTPEELRIPTATRVVPVRRIPYTGVQTLPESLYGRPEKPRVALTLGMSHRNIGGPEAAIATMLEMVGGLDIEVVATLNAEQLAGQTVPPNVSTVDFVPLGQLLPTCSAIIHHGGGGTLTTAVAHKVPQLIDSGGFESFTYSRYALDNGAGLTIDQDEQTVDEMRKRLMQVIEDPAFAAGTERLHASWLAMPSPNDIVPVLEGLTAAHRA
ncbi:nucleotide disphospho-sugar-binding domain-containing protein [Lentzea flava]|uniref:Glycosyl transferase n=1 Tax=Lentzea flava TaxID=103732 RepID=A0ABQ2V7E4_9PSEU|nr:nucleotide disphospho-sugar-binding domain-containing protein [Lentzea flava]MCP2203836.1 glycosyltransferase, activator-dependent family [Lentzea flava]GGU72074.1 glycosyl transferase [Lentzea flava]